jgi:hypothetical protein
MFFALTVGAPKPPAPLLRGPIVNIFCVDVGCSRTSGTTSQGAYH